MRSWGSLCKRLTPDYSLPILPEYKTTILSTHTQTQHTHTQLLIPEETPLAANVDFEQLARHNMSGGNVQSAVFRAASKAALRPDEERKLTMKVCSTMPIKY